MAHESASVPTSMLVAPPSPDRASMMTLYFPEEIGNHEPSILFMGMSDGVFLPDDYQDEISMMSLSQMTDTTQPDSAVAFDETLAVEVSDVVRLIPLLRCSVWMLLLLMLSCLRALLAQRW